MRKFASLSLLYFAQGLPFGFQATALPLLLRERGVSLQAIGFSGLLALPWLAKALWAPWVDRYGHAGFGRRKSWIVPLQAGLAVCALFAGRTERIELLMLLVFLMNLLAATQDIAVDALAVSWLEPSELGMGNAIQVVGYKAGMLTGGGLLVWASQRIGYAGLFNVIAVLMLLVMSFSFTLPEGGRAGVVGSEPVPLRQVILHLRAAFTRSSALPLLGIVVSYKMGETMADAMWKPLLFDRGFPAAQIGLWTGTYGMLFSLLGSFGAGLWVRRHSLLGALLWAALLRAFGVGAEWWLSALAAPAANQVIAVTCVEHLLGGAITTVMFALMMRHTEREIGATHYTLLASLEVWGKLPFGAFSGVIAQRLGYPMLFGLATLLCAAFSCVVIGLRARLELGTPTAGPRV